MTYAQKLASLPEAAGVEVIENPDPKSEWAKYVVKIKNRLSSYTRQPVLGVGRSLEEAATHALTQRMSEQA